MVSSAPSYEQRYVANQRRNKGRKRNEEIYVANKKHNFQGQITNCMQEINEAICNKYVAYMINVANKRRKICRQ